MLENGLMCLYQAIWFYYDNVCITYNKYYLWIK